jgi:hydrogenase maturation protease
MQQNKRQEKVIDGRPVVVGLGNPLMGDDGIGITVVRNLRSRCGIGARIVEAGTPGFGLIDLLVEDRTVIFIDAVDGGSDPGSVFWVNPAEIAGESTRFSLHQITLKDVLDLLGETRLRSRMKIIGIQPQYVGVGVGLSQSLENKMGEIISAAEAMVNEALAAEKGADGVAS